MNYKLGIAKNKALYHREIFISKTIAGFIILSTGIVITLKGIWMTSPLGTSTWGIILLIGMMLIIIGAITISYRG
jgi:hypothetical protein